MWQIAQLQPPKWIITLSGLDGNRDLNTLAECTPGIICAQISFFVTPTITWPSIHLRRERHCASKVICLRTIPDNSRLARVEDVSFPFSRQGNRASKRANECAWGEQKMERRGEHPLPLLLIVSHSLAVSFPSRAFSNNERLLRLTPFSIV